MRHHAIPCGSRRGSEKADEAMPGRKARRPSGRLARTLPVLTASRSQPAIRVQASGDRSIPELSLPTSACYSKAPRTPVAESRTKFARRARGVTQEDALALALLRAPPTLRCYATRSLSPHAGRGISIFTNTWMHPCICAAAQQHRHTGMVSRLNLTDPPPLSPTPLTFGHPSGADGRGAYDSAAGITRAMRAATGAARPPTPSGNPATFAPPAR
jgi:hypothetical protein